MGWQIRLEGIDQLVKILESGSIFNIEAFWLVATGGAVAGRDDRRVAPVMFTLKAQVKWFYFRQDDGSLDVEDKGISLVFFVDGK